METQKYYMPPAAMNPDGSNAIEQLFQIARTVPLPLHIHDINDGQGELIIRCPQSKIAPQEVYEEQSMVKTECIAGSIFRLQANDMNHQFEWKEVK